MKIFAFYFKKKNLFKLLLNQRKNFQIINQKPLNGEVIINILHIIY